MNKLCNTGDIPKLIQFLVILDFSKLLIELQIVLVLFKLSFILFAMLTKVANWY